MGWAGLLLFGGLPPHSPQELRDLRSQWATLATGRLGSGKPDRRVPGCQVHRSLTLRVTPVPAVRSQRCTPGVLLPKPKVTWSGARGTGRVCDLLDRVGMLLSPLPTLCMYPPSSPLYQFPPLESVVHMAVLHVGGTWGPSALWEEGTACSCQELCPMPLVCRAPGTQVEPRPNGVCPLSQAVQSLCWTSPLTVAWLAWLACCGDLHRSDLHSMGLGFLSRGLSQDTSWPGGWSRDIWDTWEQGLSFWEWVVAKWMEAESEVGVTLAPWRRPLEDNPPGAEWGWGWGQSSSPSHGLAPKPAFTAAFTLAFPGVSQTEFIHSKPKSLT